MIWYNGDIHAVHLNGHYHVAAYLGDVLVWRENVRPMQGVEYLMTAAEMGAAAVPASELGADAVLPSPRVRHAKMVPAAAGAMQAQETQQLSVSCGMESLPASLPEMRLPLALGVQGKLASAGASELEGVETRALPVSCGMGSGGPAPMKGRLKVTKPALAATAAAAPPVLADMNAVLASAVLSGGAKAVEALPAVLPGKMKAALTGGGAAVGASVLPAALGVKLTASCGMEVRPVWEYPVQDGETLRVTQVYGALQESDGILTLDTPVSGKVVKEQDGIAWIIPDGTEDWDWFNGNIRVTAARQETKRVAFRNDSGETINAKVYGVGEAIVSPEALADNARPMGYIALDDTVLGRAEDLIDTSGANVWMFLMSPPVSLSNWPAGELRVFTAYGGSYSGEYPYPESSTHMRDQTLLSIRVERG